ALSVLAHRDRILVETLHHARQLVDRTAEPLGILLRELWKLRGGKPREQRDRKRNCAPDHESIARAFLDGLLRGRGLGRRIRGRLALFLGGSLVLPLFLRALLEFRLLVGLLSLGIRRFGR